MQIQNLAADADSFTSNAYLLDNTTLIDTGADDIVLEHLEDTAIDTVVITHSHWDHIENLPTIIERFDPTVHAFEPGNLPGGVEAEKISDGDTISLGATNAPFLVIHTPGHKNDHVCLYNPDENILFSGDLIFPGGSFGRTDLDEGDRDTLINSIQRIADLDVQELYAGHSEIERFRASTETQKSFEHDEPMTEDVNQQIQDSLMNAKKHEPKYPD